MTEQRNVAVLKAYLKLWDSWPNGGTFPGLRDGDKKAAEYLACVREIVAAAEAERLNNNQQLSDKASASLTEPSAQN